MAITIIGSVTGTGTNSTYNIDLTSLNIQEGDVLIGVMTVRSYSGEQVANIASFTKINETRANPAQTIAVSSYIGYLVATSTPPSSVAIGSSGDVNYGTAATITVFRGVDTNNILDVLSTSSNSGSGYSQPDSPSSSPITNNSIVISIGGACSYPKSSVTVPGGYTLISYNSVNSYYKCASLSAYKFWSGSGSEDPAAWYITNPTSTSWAMFTLVLRPLILATGSSKFFQLF